MAPVGFFAKQAGFAFKDNPQARMDQPLRISRVPAWRAMALGGGGGFELALALPWRPRHAPLNSNKPPV